MSGFNLATFDPPLVLPVLRFGPISLRPFESRDLDLVLEASADPSITSITSLPRDATERDAEAFINRQHTRAAEGHGYSLVLTNSEGRGIGSVGLWLRDIENGRATAGYWVIASGRGARAASWGLCGLVNFAFGALEIPRLQLYIEPWNTASVRTARFAGFTFEAHLRGWERINGAQHDADCYSFLRSDWEAS